MKKLLLISVLSLFVSCEIGNEFPNVENITNGKKWTLEIGSSPSEVYKQLQELNLEKKFHRLSITSREYFSKPEELQKIDIALYNAITLETTSGRAERALIRFNQDKVSSIEIGGGLLDAVTKWPENLPNETTILINDSIDKLYIKLLEIYKIPKYKDYQIILPDKPLDRPYDIDMRNYDEWYFSFSNEISSSKSGRNSVTIYFKNDKLIKIRNEYEEFQLVN